MEGFVKNEAEQQNGKMIKEGGKEYFIFYRKIVNEVIEII